MNIPDQIITDLWTDEVRLGNRVSPNRIIFLIEIISVAEGPRVHSKSSV